MVDEFSDFALGGRGNVQERLRRFQLGTVVSRYGVKADLHVTADSETWLGFLAKERSLLWALLRRRIRIKGSPKLLMAFGKCFPS